MKQMRAILWLVGASAFVTGCDKGTGTVNEAGSNQAAAVANGATAAPADTTILDTLSKTGELATLSGAMKAAGLTETLSGAQPYTLFAPSDSAFQKLAPGSVDALMAPEGKGRLTALLTSHLVPGTVTAEDLARAIERGKGKAQIATIGGSTLTFTKSGDVLSVAGADGASGQVSRPDLMQSNGVVHIVDGLLTPG